jgi:hypothetical protein
MNTSEHILVIVLAAALALFLLLSVVVVVQVIRLLRVVRRIIDKAETVIESAETVGTIFKNASGPLALVRVVRNVMHMAQGNKKQQK